jgi:glucoamylase
MGTRAATAPGGPGIEPRWTQAAKEAVGTARSAASHVWYTVSHGAVDEVYWPTIDRPQIRSLQLLVTDGETFFHDERRHLTTTTEKIDPDALAVRVTNTDPEGRYRIVKDIVTDPDQSALLVRVRLDADPAVRDRLRVFVLCAPHLEIGGWGNSGRVESVGDRTVLTAWKEGTWLALGASVPILRASVGYVGVNDGWQDLARNLDLTWEFAAAEDGNIALTGELDVEHGAPFTVALTFSDRRHGAITALLQALGHSFDGLAGKFIDQWRSAGQPLLPLGAAAGDGGALYRTSCALLLAHEDKLYPGALIASLSIPWGEAKGDHELGGYHLVWTRDMVNSATGLLAAGNTDVPMHALIYLAASQLPDGGFHQNFWVTGDPYWTGVQLDEVAFPILLAWRMHRAGALEDFDPFDMVVRAAGYLVRNGPATPQERWEELGGYSPSTLASNIAALVCAATMCRERGDDDTATYLETYADFLECHIEPWTVTTQGTLLDDVPRHFIRINPGDPDTGDDDPEEAMVHIANLPDGVQRRFPARDVVDAGFLELVRYGIRSPGDPLIEDSLLVVDATIKADLDEGPVWYRYNHDGYGQRDNGDPFEAWGVGRPWPLLTGERGHYELAAGRDPTPHIEALECFAHGIGLLPEQVWDADDLPDRNLFRGRPTGAAMPLMWAHAEYIKLLRSIADGRVFDLIPEVADRYQTRNECRPLEVWKPNRRPRTVPRGWLLRIQAAEPFDLVWTGDDWESVTDSVSAATRIGIHYVDIAVPETQRAPIRFTFRWSGGTRWEGRDYCVEVA